MSIVRTAMGTEGMPLAILGRQQEAVVFIKCAKKVLPDVELVTRVRESLRPVPA